MDITKLFDEHIAQLESQLAALRKAQLALGSGKHAVKTRQISAAGRARIGAAAKKRWAAYRKAKGK